jgi:hypothetical protein
MLDCLNSICQVSQGDAIKTGLSSGSISMTTMNGNAQQDEKLAKLRAHEAALRIRGQQLQERAAHLERVRRVHTERLLRRIDAHEKILLGALVKKSGLAILQEDGNRQSDGDVSPLKNSGLGAQSAQYDQTLILGAFLWLSSLLNRPENDVVKLPSQQCLRDLGHQAMNKKFRR